MKNKNHYFRYFISFLLLFFITACEQEITVDLPVAAEQLVVEGKIETGQKPFVLLTKNAPYFASMDSNSIKQYTVKNAFVTINNGMQTDTMKGNNYYYVATKMLGENGKTYTLKVVVDGKTYTSTTKINKPIPLDSVWFKVQKKDTFGFIWAHLTDPTGIGNAYRWYAKRIGKDNDFVAPMGSVFDDKFIDGKSFDFGYNRGSIPDSKSPDDYKSSEENGYFKKGDVVIIKFCSISEAEYNYLRRFEMLSASNGNPFASPSTLPTNISNNALGLWCGYGTTFDTLLLK